MRSSICNRRPRMLVWNFDRTRETKRISEFWRKTIYLIMKWSNICHGSTKNVQKFQIKGKKQSAVVRGSEPNNDCNLNTTRHGDSRHFRKNKRECLKVKDNELAKVRSRLSETYRNNWLQEVFLIWNWVGKDKKCDLIADSHNILNIWRINSFSCWMFIGGLETRWGEWSLSVYLILSAAPCPQFSSGFNRNESHKNENNVSGE